MAGLKRECGEMFLQNFPLPWERVRVRASGRTLRAAMPGGGVALPGLPVRVTYWLNGDAAGTRA